MVSLLLLAIPLGAVPSGVVLLGRNVPVSALDFLLPLVLIGSLSIRRKLFLPAKIECRHMTMLVVVWLMSLSISADPLYGVWLLKVFIVGYMTRIAVLNATPRAGTVSVRIVITLLPIIILVTSLLQSYPKWCSLVAVAESRAVRVEGLGGTNLLASFYAGLAPIMLGLAITRSYVLIRTCALLGFVSCLTGTLLTSSRAGSISLVLGIGALLLFIFMRDKDWRRSVLILLVTGTLSCVLLFTRLFNPVATRFQELSSFGWLAPNFQERLEIWKVAWQIFLKNPFLGCGLGSFSVYYAQTLGVQAVEKVNQHNIILFLLSEVGLLGTLPFVWVITFLLRKAWTQTQRLTHLRWFGRGIVAGILAFLVHSLFDLTILTQSGMAFLFVLLSLNTFLLRAEKSCKKLQS